MTYSYDGDGNRVKLVDNSGTTYFLYDGINPILELDVNKNVTAYYVYGADGIVYRKKVSGAYEYHHKDIVGGTGLMTDAAQSVIASYDYYAFGSMRLETGTSDNTHKFTGKEYDSTFRLYYFVARYYDPYIGRFLNRDKDTGKPIDPQSLNLYPYVSNHPLLLVDPDGQFGRLAQVLTSVGAAVGTAVGFLVGGGIGGAGGLVFAGPAGALGGGGIGAYEGAAIGVATGAAAGAVVGTAIEGGINYFRQGKGNSDLAGKKNEPFDKTPQMKRLSKGEIKKLKDADLDIHQLKGGKRVGKFDLFKDRQGNIYMKLQSGKGQAEPLNINIKDY